MSACSEPLQQQQHESIPSWMQWDFYFDNVNQLAFEDFTIYCKLAFTYLNSGEAQVDYILNHLSGAPLIVAWEHTRLEAILQEENDYRRDPIALLSLLERIFVGIVSPEEALKNLQNHKQNGMPVRKYTLNFYKLIRKVSKNYSSDEICDLYINGLDPPIKAWIRSIRPKCSLDEAIETARIYYREWGSTHTPFLPPHTNVYPNLTSSPVTPPTTYTNPPLNCHSDINSVSSFNQQSISNTVGKQLNKSDELLAALIEIINKPRSKQRSYNRNRSNCRDPVCYKCGVVGHISRQCPHPPIYSSMYTDNHLSNSPNYCSGV